MKINNICFCAKNSIETTVNQPEVTSKATVPSSGLDADTFSATDKKVEPLKISNAQMMLGLLSSEQIEKINTSKMLPENLLFMKAPYSRFETLSPNGDYVIVANVPWIKNGTRKLPEGYKVIKNSMQMILVVKVNQAEN